MQVLPEIALQRQDADPQARSRAGSGGKRGGGHPHSIVLCAARSAWTPHAAAPPRPGSMPLLGYITEHALLQRSARQARPPGLPAQGRRLGPSRAGGRKNRPGLHAADAVHPAARRRRRQRHERQDHHHQDGGGTARKPGPEGLHQPHRQQLHPRRGRRPAGRGRLAGPARCRRRGPGTGRGACRPLRQQGPAAVQPPAQCPPRPAGPVRRDRQDRRTAPAHRVQDHRDRGPEPGGPARRPDRRRPWTGPRCSTSGSTIRC